GRVRPFALRVQPQRRARHGLHDAREPHPAGQRDRRPELRRGPTTNPAGKRTNRGFEGLAVSPDGKFAYAILQSAMLDEGGGSGSVNRIVKFDTATGKAVAQYAYQMDTANQGRGVSALVALNDHEFLVLERNNRGVGVGAEFATADK